MTSSVSPTAPGATPPLLASPAALTCQRAATTRPRAAAARGRAATPPLVRQLQAVERVDDVEQLDGVLHLVGLQVADQVPGGRPAQLGDLGLRFLHAVLAEGLHAGRHRRPDALD